MWTEVVWLILICYSSVFLQIPSNTKQNTDYVMAGLTSEPWISLNHNITLPTQYLRIPSAGFVCLSVFLIIDTCLDLNGNVYSLNTTVVSVNGVLALHREKIVVGQLVTKFFMFMEFCCSLLHSQNPLLFLHTTPD